MASDFDVALDELLREQEGYPGWTHHADDKGGETIAGIARTRWPKWVGWLVVDDAKRRLGFKSTVGATASMRKQMDAELARWTSLRDSVAAFYRPYFWDVLNLDAEPDQMFATKLFRIAVNMGDPTATDFNAKVRAAVG